MATPDYTQPTAPDRLPSAADERFDAPVLESDGAAAGSRSPSPAPTDAEAFTGFPKEHWRQLWSNNSLERLNKEIRRRTDVVGIFPDRASIVPLVRALLAEQNGEWAVARRYMSAESIAKALSDPSEQQAQEAAALPIAASPA